MLSVTALRDGGGWTCDVGVDQAGERTAHTVTVTAEDLERYGGSDGEAAVEGLVRRSFEFLLARERPSSILRRFDLSAIRRYFPEYDQIFKV